jgi:hypothetical protein
MRFVRSKRGLATLGGLGVVACVTLFAVLPAFGSSPGEYVNPPSGKGVLPVDVGIGGNGQCSNLFPGLPAGAKEYDNNNPRVGTASGVKSGNNDGVTFDITLHSPSNTSQTLDVTGHGAAILGIGIKGGTQSTAYHYFDNKPTVPAGFVTGDTALHAPLSNNTYSVSGGTEYPNGNTPSFYGISLLNICYTTLSYIQGTVYQDVNQNGANDDGSLQSGWTVDLYAGVTPGVAGGGTLIDHQVTGAAGTYHFDVPAGVHYRVCEVPGGDLPSNGGKVWVQSQPVPSTTTLCDGTVNGTGELARGYDETPTTTTGATDDFGNVGGYSCDSAGAPLGTNAYTVGICKDGQQYVFNSGTVTSGQFTGTPFVDYWVGDPSASIPTVEQINFADPFVKGLPQYTKLLYADGGAFPPNPNQQLLTMPYCNLDPRDTSAGGYPNSYTLLAPYASKGANGSDLVLPNGATSCVISIRTNAPAPSAPPQSTTGTLQAYIYSLADNVRGAN